MMMKQTLLKQPVLQKWLSLLLCALLTVSMASCGKVAEEAETTTEAPAEEQSLPAGSVAVPYLPEDSLNPFSMSTVVNAALVSLYCRGLYYLDNGYTAVADLAQSEVVSVENVKVNLTPGLTFSAPGASACAGA